MLRNRATILLVRDNEILLVMNSRKNRWSLPGGGLRKGESPQHAAKREILEELKLKIDNPAFIGKFEGNANLHHVFFCDKFSGSLKMNGELKSYKWCNIEENLPEYVHVQKALDLAEKEGFV